MRMKRRHFQRGIYLLIVVLAVTIPAYLLQAGGPPLKEKPCAVCHKDYLKILPKSHPAVGEAAKNPCLSCHQPDKARNEATKFSAFIHNAHKEGGKVTLTCDACHAL